MRRRSIPPVEALLAELAEHGVTGAPTEAPDLFALQGLLDIGVFLADVKKKLSFEGFTWADPAFLAIDAKVTLRIAYAELVGDLPMTLEANLARVSDRKTLLAIDARRLGAREFEIGHALYGTPTLFQWPSKPVEAADPRIDDARERGWVKVLKEHNLMPGRGIVVLDEHQGILLRDDRYSDVLGFIVLLDTGHTALWWNPFARDADPDLQYWFAWGQGLGPASGWREQFFVEPE